MEKAKIKVLKGKAEGKEISVHFNPTEYTLNKSNEFQYKYPRTGLPLASVYKRWTSDFDRGPVL